MNINEDSLHCFSTVKTRPSIGHDVQLFKLVFVRCLEEWFIFLLHLVNISLLFISKDIFIRPIDHLFSSCSFQLKLKSSNTFILLHWLRWILFQLASVIECGNLICQCFIYFFTSLNLRLSGSTCWSSWLRCCWSNLRLLNCWCYVMDRRRLAGLRGVLLLRFQLGCIV